MTFINKRSCLIWSTESHALLARNLAKCLSLESQSVNIHHFPDGESKVTLPDTSPSQLILVTDLSQGNDALIELLFIIRGARQQGVKHIILVAPYLPYMRQDVAFHPGEVISQQVFGSWLGELTDTLITVDPHLHRINTLEAVIPETHIFTLNASPYIGQHLKSAYNNPLLIGPDNESAQWVSSTAAAGKLDYHIANKTRLGDKHVEIEIDVKQMSGREVVIVDDMSSTGHTIAVAAQHAYNSGATSVHAVITHALLTSEGMAVLKQANIKNIESTNTIPHSTNSIDLSNMLAATLKTLL